MYMNAKPAINIPHYFFSRQVLLQNQNQTMGMSGNMGLSGGRRASNSGQNFGMQPQHQQQQLFQQIDPDSYFTVYGDKTSQDYDAQSSEKLYVRIERKQFYALFGDYETGISVTELSRYNRSLTGLKSEMKTDRYEFNVFASETDQNYVKDEIRGDGTSGYHSQTPPCMS